MNLIVHRITQISLSIWPKDAGQNSSFRVTFTAIDIILSQQQIDDCHVIPGGLEATLSVFGTWQSS